MRLWGTLELDQASRTSGVAFVNWEPDDDLAEVGKLVDLLEATGPVPLKRIEELVDLDPFITFWAATS